MRVCLIATNGFTHDPRARAAAHQLSAAGHDVVIVASGHPRSEPCPFPITWVPTREPGDSPPVRLRRLLRSDEARRRAWHARLARAAADTGARVYEAGSAEAVSVAAEAARLTNGAVTRRPEWPDAGEVDLIRLAPLHPAANPTVVESPVPFHTPADRRAGWHPKPGRHAGRTVALIYKKTDTNPGRYLEAALLRAGVDVTLITTDFAWESVTGVDAAVFVESPPPSPAAGGIPPDVPIVFWAHHGEHHLAANVRLARRLQADLVLLAHSWHLAHYFPVPVVRFPFAVPPETFDPTVPLETRPIDVAMVGAYLRQGGPYPFRNRMVNAIESHHGTDRTAFEEGVPRTRMAELYAQAKLIPNEGGVRHFPITMRVFEAVGAGAVLWSRPVPGLDLLFTPGRHYVPMTDDFLPQLDRLLGDPAGLAEIAEEAGRHAAGHHTYDHRVDELFEVLREIRPGPRHEPPAPPEDGLAAWIDEDVDVQRILDATSRNLSAMMPDREIWSVAQVGEPVPGSFSAVAVDRDSPALAAVLTAARKYVYAGGTSEDLEAFIGCAAPAPTVVARGGLRRVDLIPDASRATIVP